MRAVVFSLVSRWQQPANEMKKAFMITENLKLNMEKIWQTVKRATTRSCPSIESGAFWQKSERSLSWMLVWPSLEDFDDSGALVSFTANLIVAYGFSFNASAFLASSSAFIACNRYICSISMAAYRDSPSDSLPAAPPASCFLPAYCAYRLLYLWKRSAKKELLSYWF